MCWVCPNIHIYVTNLIKLSQSINLSAVWLRDNVSVKPCSQHVLSPFFHNCISESLPFLMSHYINAHSQANVYQYPESVNYSSCLRLHLSIHTLYNTSPSVYIFVFLHLFCNKTGLACVSQVYKLTTVQCHNASVKWHAHNHM